jgi:hypothetical protein
MIETNPGVAKKTIVSLLSTQIFCRNVHEAAPAHSRETTKDNKLNVSIRAYRTGYGRYAKRKLQRVIEILIESSGSKYSGKTTSYSCVDA